MEHYDFFLTPLTWTAPLQSFLHVHETRINLLPKKSTEEPPVQQQTVIAEATQAPAQASCLYCRKEHRGGGSKVSSILHEINLLWFCHGFLNDKRM